jgi:hypothetical protein
MQKYTRYSNTQGVTKPAQKQTTYFGSSLPDHRSNQQTSKLQVNID